MRFLEVVSSPFKDAENVPVRLRGREALSELFHFDATVLIADRALKPKNILGQPLSIQIAPEGDEGPRIIDGLIKAFRALGQSYGGFSAYEFELVPAFWITTLTDECRIFQDMTLSEILKEILDGYAGKIDYELNISKAKTKREYCVQYNESDYDFMARMLAEEGCYYFVRYAQSGRSSFNQKLTITDAASSYFTCNQGKIGFRKDNFAFASLDEWRAEHRLHAHEWRLTDYNPLTPAQSMAATSVSNATDRSLASAKRYRGHGRYRELAHGKHLADRALDREEALTHVFSGQSRYHHFEPGAKVKFDKQPDDIEAEEAVLVSVEHDARDNTAIAGVAANALGGEDGEDPHFYSNTFACIPAGIGFVPPARPDNQRMRGLQTGIVVGPAGADIHTDEHGRIRVRLHWDRAPKDEAGPTCWIRVAQTFAGAGFGAQFIPRIGMEVLIDFIEGDQDRPLVVGCVYNGANKVAFKLADNKTQSGWRTISSPKDGETKFNELIFEDKAGSEHIKMNAGKDHTRIVAHDDTLDVGNKQIRTIKIDRTVTIKEGKDDLTLNTGDRFITLDKGHQSLKLSKGDYKIDLSAGNHDFKIDGNYKLTIAKGNQTTKLSAGASTFEAATKIQLKVGQTVVTLDPAGITIKAAMVKIQATAVAEIKGAMVKVQASGMASIEAPMTKVSGSGMLMLKGGLIMIN